MTFASRIISTQVPCKICNATAQFMGNLDFNQSCHSPRGKALESIGLSGMMVPYHRCSRCGLIFTVAMDHFTNEDFSRLIYNDDYIKVDPGYREERPAANADAVVASFPNARNARILDYGGGNGRLAELLRAKGFQDVTTYDPFVGEHSTRPHGRFDLIVCFEVAEHSTKPVELFGDLASLANEQSLIVFSTLLQPKNIDQIGLDWWYIAPRNGHVTIYSVTSLCAIARGLQMNFEAGQYNAHVLYRKVPPFAQPAMGK